MIIFCRSGESKGVVYLGISLSEGSFLSANGSPRTLIVNSLFLGLPYDVLLLTLYNAGNATRILRLRD